MSFSDRNLELKNWIPKGKFRKWENRNYNWVQVQWTDNDYSKVLVSTLSTNPWIYLNKSTWRIGYHL